MSWVSRSVEPRVFLAFQEFVAYTPVLVTLLGLGAPFSITYFSAKKLIGMRYIRQSNMNTIAIACSFIVVVLFVWKAFSNVESLFVVSLFVVGAAGAIKLNITSFYLGKKDIVLSTALRFLLKFVAYIPFAIVLVWSVDVSLDVLLVALIVGDLVLITLLFATTGWLQICQLGLSKRYRAYSFDSLVANLCSGLIIALPFLFVRFSSMTVAEKATVASVFTLVRYFPVLLAPAMQLIVPVLASMEKDAVVMKRWVTKHLIFVLAISFTFSLALSFGAETLFTWIYGSKYLEGSSYFSIYVLVLPFVVSCGFLAACISAIGAVEKVKEVAMFFVVVLFLSMTVVVIMRGGPIHYLGSAFLSNIIAFVLYMAGLGISLRKMENK